MSAYEMLAQQNLMRRGSMIGRCIYCGGPLYERGEWCRDGGELCCAMCLMEDTLQQALEAMDEAR